MWLCAENRDMTLLAFFIGIVRSIKIGLKKSSLYCKMNRQSYFSHAIEYMYNSQCTNMYIWGGAVSRLHVSTCLFVGG